MRRGEPPTSRVLLGAATAVVAAGLAVAVVGAGGRAPAAEGGTGRAAAAPAAAPAAVQEAPVTTPPTVPQAPPVPDSWIATLRAPLPWSAVPGGAAAGHLAALDPFGAPQVLALVGAPRPDGWAQAELPVRPNGAVGWIDASAVTLTSTSYRVEVSLAARTLTVSDGATVVLTTPVAVGSPRTPTPPARTYVWELVAPDNRSGAYGPFILGLAEFSTSYATFNGGDAQIGIHGTDEPSSIGSAVSHGCIRVPNDVISRLAALLPLGTPVTID